ncbi:MAG: PHP domain-containing protein [Lachnospiraceae bacterium]|nr:PHP domain-containing protein [Lachnospiraceae bacterium]
MEKDEWKRLYYDFHIHTCLSPCGDEDMTPANIVMMAKLKGLDVIAITDHNTCRNCEAAIKQGERHGMLVIPGMELTTKEEVHVLFLFSSLCEAEKFDSYVYEHLIKVRNVPEFFGRQLVMDEEDQIIKEEEMLLIQATDIPFSGLSKLADTYHGLMIPAHIEKGSNSLLSNLGFIPKESTFLVAEVAGIRREEELKRENPYLEGCRLIRDSDAHALGMISEAKHVIMAGERSREAILQALLGKGCE